MDPTYERQDDDAPPGPSTSGSRVSEPARQARSRDGDLPSRNSRPLIHQSANNSRERGNCSTTIDAAHRVLRPETLAWLDARADHKTSRSKNGIVCVESELVVVWPQRESLQAAAVDWSAHPDGRNAASAIRTIASSASPSTPSTPVGVRLARRRASTWTTTRSGTPSPV
jgi:hypothetical protein